MSAKFHKNGIVTCTPIDGFDKVSILKNDIVVGENLVQYSSIKTTSSSYGFGNTPDTYKNPIYANDFIEL